MVEATIGTGGAEDDLTAGTCCCLADAGAQPVATAIETQGGGARFPLGSDCYPWGVVARVFEIEGGLRGIGGNAIACIGEASIIGLYVFNDRELNGF